MTSNATHPCRFVLHTLPDGSEHLDLFIRIDAVGMLLTYEINPPDFEEFLPLLMRGEVMHFEIRTDETLPVEGNLVRSVPAVRKQDHRPFYWIYEGEIQMERGEIQEVARSFVRGRVYEEQVLLMPVLEN